MDRYPVGTHKRRVVEFLIRLIDIASYAVILAVGVYIGANPPVIAENLLNGFEWMIGMWVAFLVVGGLLGLVGRITTIWLLEPAADVAALVGALMYFVILGVSAFSSTITTIASGFVIVAALGVARRYLELQLFGSDPNRRGWRLRFRDALQRRIPNVTPRG